MFLTFALRSVIDSLMRFTENPDHLFFDRNHKDQIMKLIEHCRIENNWGSSFFFENTLKEMMFMDYLLMHRRSYVALQHRYENWFKTSVYKRYATEEISVLSIQQLIVEVNLVSKHVYPRDPFFQK